MRSVLALSLVALCSAAISQPVTAKDILAKSTIPRGEMTEIIPGQIRIKWRDSIADKLESGAPIQQAMPEVPGELITRLSDTKWTLWRVGDAENIHLLSQSLMRHPAVLYAEPVNKIYPLLDDPNDPDYNHIENDTTYIFTFNDDGVTEFRRLWNLFDTRSRAAWNRWPKKYYQAATKPPVSQLTPIIAVIDTGADMGHPDFMNAGGFSTDIQFGGQLVHAHSHQFNLGQIMPGGTPDEVHGHGTHVTGIAVAAGNNGGHDGKGMLGIGYHAQAMILRVFDDTGSGSDTDAGIAMKYAADNRADIINLSLGTENYSQFFQEMVTYAYQKGLPVICAANEDGNGGGDLGPIYPAACSGAFAVTAAGPDGYFASNYAGSGHYIHMGAPGGEVLFAPDLTSYRIQYIWSTSLRSAGTLYQLSQQGVIYPPYLQGYSYLVGTSMAAPHVAGAAALYMSKVRIRSWHGYTSQDVYRALQRTAQDSGAPNGAWEPYFGYGLLDTEALMWGTNQKGSVAGSISGQVLFNGTPLANVAVRAKVRGVTFQTTTQPDGTYRFDQISPGAAKVWAAPFGSLKERWAYVYAGTEAHGNDLWAGTYTGDTTKPVVPILTIHSKPTDPMLRLRMWAYDTETGIDELKLKVGSTQGGDDIYGERWFVQITKWKSLNLPAMVRGNTYYVTLTAKNGAGMTNHRTTAFTW